MFQYHISSLTSNLPSILFNFCQHSGQSCPFYFNINLSKEITAIIVIRITFPANLRGFNKFWSRWLENESRRLWWREALGGSRGMPPRGNFWNLECLWCIFQHFGQKIMTLRALLSKPFLPSHYKDILKNVQNVWRILLKNIVIFLNVWHLFYE